MKVNSIVSSTNCNLKTRKKVELSSFGCAQNSNTLANDKVSNPSKTGFLSNISFAGHTKRFEVTRQDFYDYKREVEKPIYYGTCGEIVGYETEIDYGPITKTEYAVLGDHNQKIPCSNPDVGVQRAIVMSSDFKGGRIENISEVKLYESNPKYNPNGITTQYAKVYFADRNELVKPDKISGHNYVVYAPGSSLSNSSNIDMSDIYSAQAEETYENINGIDGLGWSWT